MKESLTLINWNVGGGKFFKLVGEERERFKENLNSEIARLCEHWQPHIVLMQEVTRCRPSNGAVQDLIEPPEGYYYQMVPIHDTDMHSHPVRWRRYREAGGWGEGDYIGQGAGFLWRDNLSHGAIWDFEISTCSPRLSYEFVPIDTGLFTGDRDTEPRAAIVTHFTLKSGAGPRHVFLVNLHLSTLYGEREGGGRRDDMGISIRRKQLQVILEGIVSRHVGWSIMLPDNPLESGSIWVIGGDFNTPPDSEEIAEVLNNSFRDANPNKGQGNKTSGLGNDPTHTVDYLFVNYLSDWTRCEEAFRKAAESNPEPDLSFRASDHYPTIAHIPIC